MSTEIGQRFAAPGPKRILALDGGGSRGMISLCLLEAIERELRLKSGRPSLVLSDYFDLIGGTSVGSMVATLLAMGKDVAYVRSRFEQWAPVIFRRRSWGWLRHVFGQPAAGKGGTPDVIAYALDKGRPVVWIDSASDQQPQVLKRLVPHVETAAFEGFVSSQLE